ncbi:MULTISPECIES: ABC-F family ATP-binding cassette domain-containing protein [unclassified Granulicatella]|uniref:ABC-F family ATP-binding cassette domain-containing protein n=1 Tax=unclassified Granulicatella TaxID=2630493 RepID=UPI0010745512|nr:MULTISPECIES: ABC-F family ATP-binding cassette domain-containing protein [unclassified Granulicatella]MBF0781021.1 ABC-F family ATP-binding cassette domain-containing protein [Granulicatella sp. 19428wC4_WM01]TFU92576.1 ABC transporter ATP-binding protein [Granulicatella sp. WM01]
MIILQTQHLSKVFGTETLFQNISLQIQERSRIALVGRNGTGKSTLLKILAGIESNDNGTVSKIKDLSIGYLDQHSAVDTAHTIWEEMLSVFSKTITLHHLVQETAALLTQEHILNNPKIYEQTLNTYDTLQHELEQQGGYRYEADIRSVLHGLRFFEQDYHRSISELSGGQKTRLALAKLLLEKHDLLILDEPTNHLDIDTLSWLENYLSNYKGALLIVSHDRYFLDKVVNEVYEISQKTSHYFKGNYSYYLNEKEVRLASAWKAYDKQQAEIEKLEDFVAKNLVRASTTKRAQSRRKQLEKMVRLEKPKQDDKSMHFQFMAEKESGQVVLQAENLSIGYENTVLSSPISLDIRKQQAVALIGPNGIGKSTLLKSILGHVSLLNGEIKLGSNVTIGYYDQEQTLLSPQKDVLHELWDDYPLVNEKDIRSTLGSFLFSGHDVLKPVHTLSGGERARLLLAKLAMKHDNFLILDEPTNHLDLDSKEILEDTLIRFDGTLLFISHDRYFINRIATHIVELSKTGSTLYIGDYDYYLEKKAQEHGITQPESSAQTTTQERDYISQKETQKLRRQLERAIQQLEDNMAHYDSQIAQIENELSQPDVYTDFEKSHNLTQSLHTIRQHYDEAMTQWESKHFELDEINASSS